MSGEQPELADTDRGVDIEPGIWGKIDDHLTRTHLDEDVECPTDQVDFAEVEAKLAGRQPILRLHLADGGRCVPNLSKFTVQVERHEAGEE